LPLAVELRFIDVIPPVEFTVIFAISAITGSVSTAVVAGATG
jgi:hypothetical protein